MSIASAGASLSRHYRKRSEGASLLFPLAVVTLCGFSLLRVLVVAVQDPNVYKAPGVYFGIVKVELDRNAFEFVNIATGEHSERRFCGEKEQLPFFAGYVLSQLVVKEHGQCAWLVDGPVTPFIIVRGKDRIWHKLYGERTYDDGVDRPVLALNCHNSADDKSTFCDGGQAQFARSERIEVQ